MIEIRRVLCPIDFSDHSKRALDHAMAIAAWYESTLTVLHVFSATPVAPFGPGPVMLEPVVLPLLDRDRLLADTKAFAAAEHVSGVRVDTVLREGNATIEILGQASVMAADLLVLGTHGRSGFERLLLGSVAERVLRKASCPVLTVPKGDAGAVNEALYRTILCPVDFSESSMRALQYALSLTQEADAQLIVMHVVAHELERSSDAAVIAYDDGMTVGNFVKEREEELRTHLLKASAGAGGNEYSRVESLLTHGKPWREILRVAGERQTDLIVLGVQGRGASDLLFFGSTTQHVVREASCPVLTLRHG